MGFFNELKKLTKPYADDEEEFDEYEDEEQDEEYDEEPEEAPVRPARRSASPAYSGSASLDSGRPGVQVSSAGSKPASQVVIVRPEQYENVAEIADHLMDRRAVLLNLEHTNKDSAKRLVDFLSGCAYALRGKVKKVATLAYLIVPNSVEIVGDLVEELENEGTYL